MNFNIFNYLNKEDNLYLKNNFNIKDFFTVKTKHIDFIFGRKEFIIFTFLNEKIILKNYNVISITEPTEENLNDNLFKDFNKFIKLSFSDICYNLDIYDDNNIEKDNELTISDEQIKILKEFIINNKNNKFIIHCTVGISRSSVIGLYIEELLNELEEEKILNQELILNHCRYSPNKNVVFKTIGKIFEFKEDCDDIF